MALAKFWAPVPWMLEAAIILQTVLHEYVEAAVIAGLRSRLENLYSRSIFYQRSRGSELEFVAAP